MSKWIENFKSCRILVAKRITVLSVNGDDENSSYELHDLETTVGMTVEGIAATVGTIIKTKSSSEQRQADVSVR